MGFGEYDGTLDNAEKRIGESAGLRCLLAGALIGDWLEFLREVVRKRLEHARNDLLHSGICIGKLHREGTQQASSAPKLWRAFLQMLKKGKSLFNRVHNSGVRSTCQHLRASPKRPIQNRQTQILFRIKKIIEAAFGQLGLLTNRIHGRGRIATG